MAAITVLFWVLSLAILYQSGLIVYNIFLHPLASFPGPVLARSTLIWRFWHSMKGRFHRSIERQHQIYGPVFRVSPNELSFCSVRSWREIYGTPVAGRAHCIKSEFYDVFAAGYDSKCIGSEREPAKHMQMKRTLNPAFSSRALIDQESIIRRCIETFADRVHEKSQKGEALNMTRWYEMLAFDLLGEMAFGQFFGSIEDGKPHFWFEMLTKYLLFVTLLDNLRRFPFAVALGKILSRIIPNVQQQQQSYTRNLVERRLQADEKQQDFMAHVIGKVRSGEVSQEELNAHTSTLVIAVGETIASFLTATTYYLCKNQPCLTRLKREIRARFGSADEINSTSAGQIAYLQAVIQEGLRIFPPGAQGFPRLSPGVEIDGYYVPKSTKIYTSAWTVTHDPKNFSEPEIFKPERWLDEQSTDVKEASQPFSLGPRMCLGRNFALMKANLVLCGMLFDFDMDLEDQNQEWEALCHMHVNWLKPDLRIRFRSRS